MVVSIPRLVRFCWPRRRKPFGRLAALVLEPSVCGVTQPAIQAKFERVVLITGIDHAKTQVFQAGTVAIEDSRKWRACWV